MNGDLTYLSQNLGVFIAAFDADHPANRQQQGQGTEDDDPAYPHTLGQRRART